MADFKKSEGGIWMPDKGAAEDIVNLAQTMLSIGENCTSNFKKKK